MNPGVFSPFGEKNCLRHSEEFLSEKTSGTLARIFGAMQLCLIAKPALYTCIVKVHETRLDDSPQFFEMLIKVAKQVDFIDYGNRP